MFGDKKVFIVGPFDFPWGGANSRRVYGLAKSLDKVNFKPIIICRKLNGFDVQKPTNDFKAIEVDKYSSKIFSLLDRVLFQYVFGIIKKIQVEGFENSVVIVYGGHGFFSIVLLFWAKLNGVKIVADVVEWYDPYQLKGGPLGILHLNAKLALKYLYRYFDGLIVISSWLERKYKSFPGELIRIPPLCNVFQSESYKKNETFVRVIYAGSPGIKDQLNDIIDVINLINVDNVKIKLDILIPHRKYVESIHNLSPLSSRILVGVEHSKINDFVSSSDFSIIIREQKTFTNAGFPTKFVESLACSTPVIANLTSDLGSYLVDGVNGFVVNSTSKRDIESTLRKILELKREDLYKMRLNASLTASSQFSFSTYSVTIKNFLLKIKAR